MLNLDLKTELYPEQLSAVTHGDGPLLIIAGAGTGKTLVISHRIAHLIKQGVNPSHILALTFTEKAASEMEERVDRLVPYGYSTVNISTFHSFGDRVLRDNALELGLNQESKVLTEPERIIFLKEHLFELSLSYYRPLGNPTRFLSALLKLINRAKDEDVSPEEYLRYTEKLEETAKANSGDEELRDRAIQQVELASFYTKYQEILYRSGFLDFGDQVVLPLKLFRTRPAILKRYQERFKYILVDEFQDTNYAQFQLLKLLSEEHKNITAVCDDDQSIYKFRGAAISNVLNFQDLYPDTKLIVLTHNHRSSQPILDRAYRLIRHNDPDRLEAKSGINKRLIAINDEDHRPVEHLFFDSLSKEAETVAEIIEAKVKKGEYGYGDLAILVRANSDATPFLKALSLKGIPYKFSGSRGLYSREEIRYLIHFLKVIVNFNDSISLFHLASSEIYQFKAKDLIPCHNLSDRRRKPLYYILKGLIDGSVLRSSSTTTTENGLHNIPISHEGQATVKKIVEDIENYSQRALNQRAGEVLYSFIKESGYLQRLTEDTSKESVAKVQNIARFFDILYRFEEVALINRVVDLTRYLELLMDAGDDPPVGEAEFDEEAVHVLTVHRAKGLEFPVVFMVGLVLDRFPRRDRKDPIELPEDLVKDILPQGDFHLQEERRLFYVGMTRARRELYLTSARDYGGARSKKVSQFILEAMDIQKVEKKVIKGSSMEAINRFVPTINHMSEGVGEEGLPYICEDKALTLTPYQIDDYLTCPLKYKYIHILRVPILPHHTIIYGKAIHNALSRYFTVKMEGKLPPLQGLIDTFRASWRSEGFITREHEEIRYQAGVDALRRFYEGDRCNGIRPVAIEKSFRVELGREILKGRWDIIEERKDGAYIMDFKTSEIREQSKANDRTKGSLQMFLYTLAYTNIFGRMPAGVELHFIDSGLIGRAKYSEKHIEKALKAINDSASGIRERNFTPKSDYLNCQYCAFNNICPTTSSGQAQALL